MALFNVVPSTFFSVLSSSNKELYVDALLKLNEMFKYGVNIDFDDYLANLIALLEIREYIAEEDDDTNVQLMPLNTKARLILKRFINTGWVDKEFKEGSFKEILVLHDYSIKTLKLIEQLSSPAVKEYNSLVFSTYSSLKQACNEAPERMYDALISGRNNSIKLMDELKSLFHSIRDYHNNVSLTNNINELLKNQFDTYQALIDKIYHPIKTMDSIYRYSMPIKDILRKISLNDELLRSMSQRAVTVSLYKSQEEALQQIHYDINQIINTFNSIPAVVDEIDRKHTTYSRISIEKMQYLLSGDRTVKGKLISILKSYSGNENKQDEILKIMQNRINAARQETVDKKSLYHKNVRSRRVVAEPIKIINADTTKNDKQFNELLTSMKSLYTDKKINAYILGLLNKKEELNTIDIPVNNNSDFIILMLAVIKADNSNIKYSIQFHKDNVINNGYTIPNATIKRKDK